VSERGAETGSGVHALSTFPALGLMIAIRSIGEDILKQFCSSNCLIIEKKDGHL